MTYKYEYALSYTNEKQRRFKGGFSCTGRPIKANTDDEALAEVARQAKVTLNFAGIRFYSLLVWRRSRPRRQLDVTILSKSLQSFRPRGRGKWGSPFAPLSP